MISDLPPAPPQAQLVSDLVHTHLLSMPDLGKALNREAPRVYVDPRTSSIAWDLPYLNAQALALPEGITFYKVDGAQPIKTLKSIGLKINSRRTHFFTHHDAEAIHVLIHEHFHYMNNLGWKGMNSAQREWEEGFVDAAAVDLTTPIGFRITGEHGLGDMVRPLYRCANVVRYASRLATGDSTRSYAARQWRRWAVTLTATQRDAELIRIGMDPSRGCESTEKENHNA